MYVLFFFCKIRPSSNPLKQTPNEIKSEDLGQWMEPLRAIYRPEEFSFRVLLHWSKRMCPTWWWYTPLLVAKGTSCNSPGNWSRNNYRRICRVRRCSKTTAPNSWLSMTPHLTFVEKRYCKCVSTLTWRYSCENWYECCSVRVAVSVNVFKQLYLDLTTHSEIDTSSNSFQNYL